MPRMKKHSEGANGWSEWIAPVMTGYRLGCCDCGLVHNLQFKVHKVSSRRGARWWGSRTKGMKVLFRAQRNMRSTALVRRSDEKKQARVRKTEKA